MKIKTVDSVNDRTVDGRVFALAGGVEHTIDDADGFLVALIRDLEARGFIKIMEEPPAEPKKARISARPTE